MTEKNGAAEFEALARKLIQDGGIDPRPAAGAPRRFGSNGLRVRGKIFAMPSQGHVVLKLPKTRVDELVEAGAGHRFDPGHGRIMKEWIALDCPPARWLKLAREARDYVRG